MNSQDKENATYKKALEVLAQSHGRTYQAQARIFSEGDPGTEIFFIVSGEVNVFIGSGYSRRDLWTLTEGDIFGEMTLLDQLPRTASVTALKKTVLVTFERDGFIHLMSKYPILALKVIELMGNRMRKLDTQFKIESGYLKGHQMGQAHTSASEGSFSGGLSASMYGDD